MGILMGALAGLGKAGNDIADTSIAARQKAEDEERMAAIQEQRAKNLADYQYALSQRPAQAAGQFLADSQTPVPVTPAPVTALDQAGASAAGLTDGIQGSLAPDGPVQKLMKSASDTLSNPQATAEQKADAQGILDQLGQQVASQKQVAADAVAGQTRPPTMHEALQTAMQKAMAAGDTQSVKMLKELAGEKYVSIPDGGLLNTQTGEITEPASTKLDRSMKIQAAIADRTSANTQAKIASNEAIAKDRADVQREKIANQFPDPATITQAEKDNWVHNYVANNGSLPRSAPPVVRNNIGTWAAEKGVTPQDLSSGMAQAKYDAASANTAGHRAGALAGVEAVIPALADNALELSKKLDQGKFVPLNKLLQMSESSISDPTLSAFKVAHQALVSEYQQVISRGGTGNVTALNEAMKVLSSATSPEAYESALNQVVREVAMNTAGMKKVRSDLGGSEGRGLPRQSRTFGGMPDDIAALLNKY